MAEEIELTVEEGMAGIEPGDTVTGVVKDLGIETVETSDGDVNYAQFSIEEDNSGIEFTPSMPARITEGTQLGQILLNMGADLTVGDSLVVNDYLAPGTAVAFEVGEEEGSDGNTYLRVEDGTIRPADESDVQVDTGSDDDQEEAQTGPGLADAKSAVLNLIEDEYEGDEASDVKKALAREDKEMLKAYKELVNEGELELADDMVFVA